jgi:hypothetical protein
MQRKGNKKHASPTEPLSRVSQVQCAKTFSSEGYAKGTFLRGMHKHGASHAVAMPLMQAVGDDGTGRRGAKPVYFNFII